MRWLVRVMAFLMFMNGIGFGLRMACKDYEWACIHAVSALLLFLSIAPWHKQAGRFP